jgi:hypothetical protein
MFLGIFDKLHSFLYLTHNTVYTAWRISDLKIKQSRKHRLIHSSVICHTTGPQPLPKRFLHLMRFRASSFK